MDNANGAMETMFAQRSIKDSPEKAVLWDLFELEPANGGWKKFSDRGAVLRRLDARTLKHLRGWLEEKFGGSLEELEENAQEAMNRVGPGRIIGLWTDVSLSGSLRAQPGATGHVVDMLLLLRIALLQQQPGFMLSGRNQRKRARNFENWPHELPRETFRRVERDMQGIGFSLDKKFTTDDLAYIMFSKRRGRPENPS